MFAMMYGLCIIYFALVSQILLIFIKVKQNENIVVWCELISFWKEIFLEHDYLDFALADSVLHFNNKKRGHVGIFGQIGLDVVSILTFIIVGGGGGLGLTTFNKLHYLCRF